MSIEIKSRTEYDEKIKSKENNSNDQQNNNINIERVRAILDIRKFEIDLYWKRATYFWTFISLTFGGYISISLVKSNVQDKLKPLFLINCLGVIFSLSWYLVNKASKYWQENWEAHLDLNEDVVLGSLYKLTTHHKEYSNFWSPTKAYAGSVSKINMLLSFYVLLVWVFLFGIFFNNYLVLKPLCKADWFYTLFGLLTFVIFLSILLWTKTKNNGVTKVHFIEKKIEDVNPSN